MLDKIFSGLEKTRKTLTQSIENLVNSFSETDEEFFEELEEVLILADLGVTTTGNIIERVKAKSGNQSPEEIKKLLQEEISSILEEDFSLPEIIPPAVLLIVGVNGVGKTTSIGKLSKYFLNNNKKVIIAAADTFRAAAADQLEIWASRTEADIVRHKENSDPSAVIFDTIKAAKARGKEILIADTAGRLHNKVNLMEELKKIHRVISKEYPEAMVKTLLVLDANTGQNALLQAKAFKEAVNVDGIILTKLDSTAKGGVVVAIKEQLNIPIYFVGVGEKAEDFIEFKPEEFAAGLL